MKNIYKYNLERVHNQLLEIPSNQILSVEEQFGNIVVYAMVDTEDEFVQYLFSVVGTGDTINFDIDSYTFLGTVKRNGGNGVYHVFYKKVKVEDILKS